MIHELGLGSNLQGQCHRAHVAKINIRKKWNIKDCQPSLWFTETFSTPLQPLNGIPQNLAGSKIATPSTKFLFLGRLENYDGRHASDLLRIFRLPCLEPLNGIQQILTGGKYSTSATKFVFFWPLVISIHACFFPRKRYSGIRLWTCGPLVLLKCVNRSHLWPCQFSIRDWILLVCFSWRYEATEVPRVNFVMREALFEIYTWILCRFIPSWETNK